MGQNELPGDGVGNYLFDMSHELLDALAPLLARLEGTLPRDPVLRRELAALARALGNWLDSPTPPEATPKSTEIVEVVAPPSPPDPKPVELRPVLPPLQPRFGMATVPESYETYDRDHTDFDLAELPVLVSRCRLKADCARLVARRLAGEPFNPAEDAQLFQRANVIPNCFLWILAKAPSIGEPRIWEELAGAFDTAAAMGELLTLHEQVPPDLIGPSAAEVYALAAEAQSILLYAVAATQLVRQDFEQVQLYIRTIEATKRLGVYIHRFLKREHRSDPATWPDLLHRITEAGARLRSFGNRDKVRKRVLNNLRYKLTKLRDNPNGHAAEWPRIAELLDEAIREGIPPSHVELRDLLMPVLDFMPDDLALAPTTERIFREIDRYLTDRPSTVVATTEAPTAEVAAVARHLRGRELVLIGGLQRPGHRTALCEAFELSDVNWLAVPEHTSTTIFEAPIARDEVAVVLLATRWASHDYQNVKEYCEKYGKLFVKLPGGYSPNQVAYQILQQVGDRLRG